MSNKSRIEELNGKLDDKDFSIFFYTIDTKGNPKGSIANTYYMVKNLIELGYDAKILFDKADFVENHPAGWLGEEFLELPHACIETDSVGFKAEDFVVVPEIHADLMKDLAVKGLPSKSIVLCQDVGRIFEILDYRTYWSTYRFNDAITTSEKTKKDINGYFPSTNVSVIPPVVSEHFKNNIKLKKPIVNIMSRNQKDINDIIKAFLLKHPVYSWIGFKDLRGLAVSDFASVVDEACVSIWIDDIATFGTFPLESIECNTPVIAKIPENVPSWATTTEGALKNSVMWVSKTMDIPDMLSRYLQAWLEDNIPTDLTDAMKLEQGKYTMESQKEAIESVFAELVANRKKEFELALEKENK